MVPPLDLNVAHVAGESTAMQRKHSWVVFPANFPDARNLFDGMPALTPDDPRY